MLAEIVSAAVLMFGQSSKAEFKKALHLDKGVQTGGYHKPEVAQYQPCVWPNRCAKSEAKVEFVLAAGPITTCQWPNRCSSLN